MSATQDTKTDQAAKDLLNKTNSRIKDVWDNNLEEEIENISKLVEEFNYIGMDTEFPGFCIK